MEERYGNALATILTFLRGECLMDFYKPLSADATNKVIRFIELVISTDRELEDIASELN